MSDDTPKRPCGRPVERPMPDPIPDSPENIMRALLPPPKRDDEWDYLKEPGIAGS